MSKRPEPGWSLWCDWPDCDYQFEAGDYTIFGDGWDLDDIVTDSDGHVGVDGKHYCHQHPCVWASDLADGTEQEPPKPYLLIHDGDTDDPTNDDGKVTLIEAAS